MSDQIPMTPELQSALLARLKAEYAETCVANFAMDILVKELVADKVKAAEKLAELIEHNTALGAKNRELMDTVASLRVPRVARRAAKKNTPDKAN